MTFLCQDALSCRSDLGFNFQPLLTIPPCLPGDVALVIQNLKSSSLDATGIHPQFLIDGCGLLSRPLAYLVNLSLSTARFPDLLKIARVVPSIRRAQEMMQPTIGPSQSSLFCPS
eukprot:Pompholyxophrys_punicea_v1_NODE_417_length_2014_cov_7.111281.p2 type:complete len:115 gc:universal NODE_417_length_2014_cov_7.111281:1571-1227(-)